MPPNPPRSEDHMHVLRILGRNIHDTRATMGMSKTELARRVGIHPNTIKRYEWAESCPTIFNLVKIAKALHVDISVLFIDTGV